MKKFFRKLSFAIRSSTRARMIAFLFVFCFGLLVGFAIEWRIDAAREAEAVFGFQKIHPFNNHFKFINPLLGFDSSEKKHGAYSPLENKLQTYIGDPQVSGRAADISVYFRNLENGDWVGVNEDTEYDPASLLKVPIMIYYLKLAESDPSVLSRTYAYTASDLANLKLAPGNELSTRLVENKFYTVEELIIEMIMRSDNIAKYLLILNSNQKDLNDIYGELGVLIHKEGNTYVISARTYSLFFRTLYNATFLNQGMSEEALKILSKAEFKDGLVAGVPSDINVAHKFGQYATVRNGKVTSVEAHDCGIIYHIKSPYLLCVMTRGNDTKQLEEIIQQISRLTYDFIK